MEVIIMVTETSKGSYDVHNVGVGEGLYGLDVWELERLKDEIMVALSQKELTKGKIYD